MTSSPKTYPSGYRITSQGGADVTTFDLATSGAVTLAADEAGRPMITVEGDRDLVTLCTGDIARIVGRRRTSGSDGSASGADRQPTYGVRFFDDLDSVENWLVEEAIPDDLRAMGVEVTDRIHKYVRGVVHQIILEVRANLAREEVLAAG